MTYRRLFHYLLVGSTILLAGLWWMSLRNRSEFGFAAGTSIYYGILDSATISLEYHPARWWVDRFGAEFSPNTANDGYRADGFGIAGESDMGWFNSGFPGAIPYWHLDIPIWVPYLLFMGSAHAFCRAMEKRSDAVKETKSPHQPSIGEQ